MTSARRSIGTLVAAVLAFSLAGLAFGGASAFASFSLNESFGPLVEPRAVAVESSTGDVFVNVGKDANTVETVTLSSPPVNSTFKLTFPETPPGGYEHLGLTYQSTGAEGEGNLTSGSKEVSSLTVSAGMFVKGEAVSGEGIEPGTTIESVEPTKLVLSTAATGTKTGVHLTANIPYNAEAEVVERALDALGGKLNLYNSRVNVKGSVGGPYRVEFTAEALQEKKIETMECTGSSFSCEPVVNKPAENTRGVEKLSATGAPLGEITAVGAGAPEPLSPYPSEGLAVDNSGGAYTGDVYVATGIEAHGSVDRFKPKAGHPNEYEYETRFSRPPSGAEVQAITVAENGDLYVVSGRQLAEYEPDGMPVITEWNQEAEGIYLPFGGVAVRGQYVYMDTSEVELKLVRFTQNGITHLLEGEELFEELHGGSLFHGVTIDPANGDVFATIENATHESHVHVFSETGTPLEEFGTGDIGASEGIAYSPHNGDVYVTDLTSGQVHVFQHLSSGEPPVVTSCGAEAKSAVSALVKCMIEPNATSATWALEYRTVGGNFTVEKRTVTKVETVEAHITGLTPETKYEWRVSAVNENGSSPGEGGTFETLPVVAGVTKCVASVIGAEGATLTASLEPKGNPTRWVFQYGIGSYKSETTAQSTNSAGVVTAEATLAGLVPNSIYQCRLVATNEEVGPTEGLSTDGAGGSFTTLAEPPRVSDAQASGVTSASALLSGTVNPEHSETTYHLVYVPEAEYEPSAFDPYAKGGETAAESAGEAFGDVKVGPVFVGELAPGTTYDYALVASNAAPGSPVTGADHTFTTAGGPPLLVSTGEASDVTHTSATISGVVDPHGIPTVYEFEVGTDTTYGGAPVFASAGEGEGAETIAATLEDLAPGTTYHYRLVARNADGTSYGGDMTFTTAGIPSPIAAPVFAPLLATPSVAFPVQAPVKKKTLTRAQKLAKALKACAKDRKKSKRLACKKQARKQYGPARKKAKTKGKT